DGLRRKAPKWRRAAVGAAGGEFRLGELGDIAFAAGRAGGSNAGVVLGDDAQLLHEAIPEVVAQGVAIGADDVAVRLLQDNVADGGQGVGPLVVGNLVGGQDVVVVIDLDVTAGDNVVAAIVVDQLIALKVQWLR